MDDDIDFEVSMKKASARKGRRAKGSNVDDDLSADNNAASQDERPAMRKGGWGDEEDMDTTVTGKAKSGRRRGEQTVESVNTGFTKFDDDDDDGSDNDIPVIPDLEDSTPDDPTAQIAIAPSVAVNKVTSYQDLDKDLQRTAQFSMMDGDVDLKLLMKHLVAEADATEDDKMWHWEHLFTEVASELQAEWDANEADNADVLVS